MHYVFSPFDKIGQDVQASKLTFFKNKERNRNGWKMKKRSYYNFKLQIISKVCLLYNR